MDPWQANVGSPSHVLQAMSVEGEWLGAVRFSLGRETTQPEIDTGLALLVPTVRRLQHLPPFGGR